MALDLSGSLQMSQDVKQFQLVGNNLERQTALISYLYEFDSGNSDNYPSLPSGADIPNFAYYDYQTLSGIDSYTYNFNSLTGNFFNRETVLNFDTIYALGIFSTGNLVVSGQIDTNKSPFGYTTGDTIGIEHNIPFLIQENESGWDANYLSDFTVRQPNDDGIVEYELCTIGYLNTGVTPLPVGTQWLWDYRFWTQSDPDQIITDYGGLGNHGFRGSGGDVSSEDFDWVASGADFDGTSKYGTVGTPIMGSSTSDWSLVAVANAIFDGSHFYCERTAGLTRRLRLFRAGLTAPATARVAVINDASSTQMFEETSSNIYSDGPHSVIITYNVASGDCFVYVDGQLDSQDTNVVGDYTDSTEGVIGVRLAGYDQPFIGTIFAMAAIREYLTSGEALQLHNFYKEELGPLGVNLN